MKTEQRLREMGMELPPAGAPGAMYLPVKQMGNALFISGHVPARNGEPVYTGKVGGQRTLEEAQEAARLCVLNMLASVKEYLGDLDRVANVVKLLGLVNSEPDFTQQHLVINAASQMLYDLFGETGRHARSAVGVNVLPLDYTVEIEAVFEVRE